MIEHVATCKIDYEFYLPPAVKVTKELVEYTHWSLPFISQHPFDSATATVSEWLTSFCQLTVYEFCSWLCESHPY